MTDVATSTEATTEAAEKVELTLDQKIEQAEARLAKLRQQKLTEQNMSNIQDGDKVTIKFGRGEKVRHIDGKVVGVALPNVAVLAADLETYKVHVRDIIANERVAAASGVTNPEEIDPVTGRRPDEAGSDETIEAQIGTFENEGGAIADNSSDPLENA